MRPTRLASLLAVALLTVGPTAAPPPSGLPAAIWADPPSDAAHPARMEVLHIPSHRVSINGIAYLAAGAGDHPTAIISHGLPGKEKNLDCGTRVSSAHEATDHGGSDHRIALETRIIDWLTALH